MVGLVPTIHVLPGLMPGGGTDNGMKTRMLGTSPGMTE